VQQGHLADEPPRGQLLNHEGGHRAPRDLEAPQRLGADGYGHRLPIRRAVDELHRPNDREVEAAGADELLGPRVVGGQEVLAGSAREEGGKRPLESYRNPSYEQKSRRADPFGRRKAKKGATKKVLTVTKSASAKTPTKSKADFVRARAHLSPKEIVEDAKTEGVKFDVAYIYRVRGLDKAARKKKRAVAKITTSTPTAVNGAVPSVTSPAKPASSTEDLLRAVAAELGLGRAVAILEGERARVRTVIGG
jgi:hypothetical protein